MSLVIIKVDKANKTHSIYCDGIRLSDSNIETSLSNKICHINTDKYDVLLGCAGSAVLAKYIRIHLKDKLLNYVLSDFSSKTDMVEVEISNIFRELKNDFCEENHLSIDNRDYNVSCIISINGNILSIYQYDNLLLIQHYC